MKQSDLNHLRRLLGWIRCDIGQSPAELQQTMIDVAGGLGHPEISPEAKARMVETYRRAESIPLYVRAAVKALEKVLAGSGRRGPAAAGAGREGGAEEPLRTDETRASIGLDPDASAGREPVLDDVQIERGLGEIGVYEWGQRGEDWLAGAGYAARLLRADAFPPIDPVQAHVAHCAGCETCDGWRGMLGSQRQTRSVITHYECGRSNGDGTYAAVPVRAPVAGEAQRLDAPAQVGGTRFGKGIHWSTVIRAAQHHHQYMQDPAREAERIAQAKRFQAFVAGDAAPPASAAPVAVAKDGNLFWYGDPVARRGFNGDLYLAPQAYAAGHGAENSRIIPETHINAGDSVVLPPLPRRYARVGEYELVDYARTAVLYDRRQRAGVREVLVALVRECERADAQAGREVQRHFIYPDVLERARRALRDCRSNDFVQVDQKSAGGAGVIEWI